MVLLTRTIASKIPKLYDTEESKLDEKIAHAKLFLPGSSWTWYVVEFDGRDLCFGYVDSGSVGSEYGYFSLSELESLQGPMGMRVERDLYYKPSKLPVTLK